MKKRRKTGIKVIESEGKHMEREVPLQMEENGSAEIPVEDGRRWTLNSMNLWDLGFYGNFECTSLGLRGVFTKGRTHIKRVQTIGPSRNWPVMNRP